MTTPHTITLERTALSDRAVSYLRTVVPTLWGAVVATILRITSPHLPGDVGQALADLLGSELALTLVLTAAIAVWYWLWRRLEHRIPDWAVRLVLGSARTPGYALPPTAAQHEVAASRADAVAVAVDLSHRSAGMDTEDTSDAKTEVAEVLGHDFGGYDEPPAIDGIDAAEAIVERLIALGWRPTRSTVDVPSTTADPDDDTDPGDDEPAAPPA